MATPEPTAAPTAFVRLLRKAIAAQGLSLREIARQIGASTAYMSRLVNEQRGLPADETIVKLEDVLDIPRGKLLYTAGRLDSAASRVLMKQDAGLLMRTLAKLTDEEMVQVQKVAENIVSTRKMEIK